MRSVRLAIGALFCAMLAVPAAGQDSGEIEIEPVPAPEVLRSEAFVAAQYSQISGAAAALDRVTARFTAGSGELATLEKQRDEKLALLAAIDRRFTALIEQGGNIDEAQRRTLSEERRTVRAEVDAIEERIGTEFPQYFELTRPRPLDIAQTQALLNDDEGLMMVLVSDDAAYIWGLTHDAATWARSEALSQEKVAAKVRELRGSMEVDKVVEGEEAASTALAFDRDLAFQIYKELIAPVEDVIGGKEVLLTNVSGALTSLPLGLLITAEPQGSDLDADAVAESAWLANRYALAELPSVSSLRALRCLLIPAKDMAHPGCSTVAVSNKHAGQTGSDIILAGYGAPSLAGGVGGTRAIKPELAGDMYDGKLADTDKLRKMAYLPQAKAELEKLGQTFGKDAAIVIGDAATESAVKGSKEIPNARLVVFATHGLLASEIGSNAEPGLVFTPPPEDKKSEWDDGLLTASEAAQLDLKADLVVLSACNTAAGDGKPGAEGLSGLARAFFFAGARSMLVSHWSVSDAATSMLMEKAFEGLQSEDIAGRARAFQVAMQTVRDNLDYDFTSPKFWAAFTLVGEPGS